MDIWFWVFWVACGVPAYGLNLAFFQRGYPGLAEEDYRMDLARAVTSGVLGPLGLLATLITMISVGKYCGFKWW